MNEIKNLNITMEQIEENAKKFNYEFDTAEWDGGECIIVYQSMYYQITYYFNEDKILVNVEAKEVK